VRIWRPENAGRRWECWLGGRVGVLFLTRAPTLGEFGPALFLCRGTSVHTLGARISGLRLPKCRIAGLGPRRPAEPLAPGGPRESLSRCSRRQRQIQIRGQIFVGFNNRFNRTISFFGNTIASVTTRNDADGQGRRRPFRLIMLRGEYGRSA